VLDEEIGAVGAPFWSPGRRLPEGDSAEVRQEEWRLAWSGESDWASPDWPGGEGSKASPDRRVTRDPTGKAKGVVIMLLIM